MQLYKCFLQLQDFNERAKIAENDLKVIFPACAFFMENLSGGHNCPLFSSVFSCCGACCLDLLSAPISQALVDNAMAEIDMAEDATTKDGSGYENGVV